jgi:polyphosphate kinase
VGDVGKKAKKADDVASGTVAPIPTKKERNRAYERALAKLQVEIAHFQAWVKASGAPIVIVFEGRDAAGTGGMIKRLIEKVSPRVFRVAAPRHRAIAGRRRSICPVSRRSCASSSSWC